VSDNNMAQREMTLEEIVRTLPHGHRAEAEYLDLLAKRSHLTEMLRNRPAKPDGWMNDPSIPIDQSTLSGASAREADNAKITEAMQGAVMALTWAVRKFEAEGYDGVGKFVTQLANCTAALELLNKACPMSGPRTFRGNGQ
jgi:hypothetical protein